MALRWTPPLLVALLAVSGGHVTEAQLTVTSLPLSFYGSASVVEGSVIWLYCKVNSISSSLSVTWNTDGGTLVQDVPHIRLRTSISSSSTTLLLVMDNVVPSDAGLYQCTAQDGTDTATGDIFNMTVISSAAGALRVVTQDILTTGVNGNRTAASNGDNITLSFTAGHVGDDTTIYNSPTVMWFKDGVPVISLPNNVAVGNNGQLGSTLSFTFQESDTGVYQCIFTDSNSQIYGTFPLRIDTGAFTIPVRVSPEVAFVPLAGKLVVEVAASGAYSGFPVWTRNLLTLGADASADLSEFVHFFEIFVREPAAASDFGFYDIFYSGAGGIGMEVQVAPTENPTTIVTSDMEVSVLEGGSINISCTSSGGPIPSITWTINRQMTTTFNQTDVSTNPAFNMNANLMTTPGYSVSTLHIVNTQYPTHNGVYTCTGTNTISGSVQNSSATISVEIQVSPEVQVSANFDRVTIGDNVILNCSVVRGNPINFTFQWFHEGVSITSTSTMDSSNTLNYPNITENELGLYSCSVSNGIGSPGTSSISITLGVSSATNVFVSTDVVITSAEVNLVTVIIIVVVVFGTIISLVAVLVVIIFLRLKTTGSAKKISSRNISEINPQNFQLHPSELLPPQSNDIHDYDTIRNDAISQQSGVDKQGVHEEEFAYKQCEAYQGVHEDEFAYKQCEAYQGVHEDEFAYKQREAYQGVHEDEFAYKQCEAYQGVHEDEFSYKQCEAYQGVHEDELAYKQCEAYQGVHEEEFAYKQCEAYDTHKSPGRRNGAAEASSICEKTYELTDHMGSQMERREMNQSYEDIKDDLVGSNVEFCL